MSKHIYSVCQDVVESVPIFYYIVDSGDIVLICSTTPAEYDGLDYSFFVLSMHGHVYADMHDSNDALSQK